MECKHCGSELKFDENQIAQCKKCKCLFRVVLVSYDAKCYEKKRKAMRGDKA